MWRHNCWRHSYVNFKFYNLSYFYINSKRTIQGKLKDEKISNILQMSWNWTNWMWINLYHKDAVSTPLLALGRTRKLRPHVVQGGGWTPLEFLICCGISKRFYLQWKGSDLLNKMRYILWVVALLEACDVTNNGRHLGRHLGFYQELEIRLKPRGDFFAWHEK